MTSAKPKRMKRFFLTRDEKEERKQAVRELNSFIDNMQNILYNYRSYMPGRVDHSNVSQGLWDLKTIINERSDWALAALKNLDVADG